MKTFDAEAWTGRIDWAALADMHLSIRVALIALRCIIPALVSTYRVG